MDASPQVTTVLITGASSGIGRALALEYGAVGCRILLSGRSEERLAAVAKEVAQAGGQPETFPADLGAEDQVHALAAWATERIGAPDILIHNAAYGMRALMEAVPPEDLRRIFQVNVHSPVLLTQLLLPAMKERRRGQIINVSSVLGRRAVPTVGPYCMTKFALAAFSAALRAEVARFGIHVLEAEPGQTRTAFLDHQQVVGEHDPYGQRPDAMTAEACARRIVRAARRGKDRVLIGVPARGLVLFDSLAHGTLNRILAGYVRRNYSS